MFSIWFTENDPAEYNFNKVLNGKFNNKLNRPNDICSVECLLDTNVQWYHTSE